MKSTSFTFQRLPMVFAISLLGTSMLLSGCSKTENTETKNIETKKDTGNTTAISTPNASDAKVNTQATATSTDNKPSPANTETVSKTISPIAAAAKQPSLLTNPTETGSAENTVKLALDTLYYGDAKEATTYYQVDMANFAEELKNTQSAFQQTVESVTITETKYNKEKTRATVSGEIKLKGQNEPAPLTYELQKINGEWKILG